MRKNTDNCCLKIGIVEQKDKGKDKPATPEEVFLDDEARKSNLLVISTKNSGKSNTLIPYIFLQDVKNEDAGVTFFVGRSSMAVLLFTIAKEHNRKVKLIKPSADVKVLDKLIYSNLNAKDLSKVIDEEILDYSKAIRDKEIIIIDMEYDKYSSLSLKASVAMLLQLQQKMINVDMTLRRRHYVYIDDAYRYVDYLNNLLQYGDDYNLSTTLFFGSRSQFKTKYNDYSSLIDTNVRNTLLLQGITYEDAVYYAKRIDLPEVDNPDRYFNEAQVKDLLNRKYGQFTYEILGKDDYVRKVGVGQLYKVKKEELEKFIEKSKRKVKTLVSSDAGTHDYLIIEENKNFERLLRDVNPEKKATSFTNHAISKDKNNHNNTTQEQSQEKLDKKEFEGNKNEEKKILTLADLPSSVGNLSKEEIDRINNKQTNKNKKKAMEKSKQKQIDAQKALEKKKVEIMNQQKKSDNDEGLEFDGEINKSELNMDGIDFSKNDGEIDENDVIKDNSIINEEDDVKMIEKPERDSVIEEEVEEITEETKPTNKENEENDIEDENQTDDPFADWLSTL